MKKKLFAFVMAAAMILSLAACGSSGGGKGAAAVDTATVAVGAVIIARDDIPEDDIYAFTSAIFENIEAGSGLRLLRHQRPLSPRRGQVLL